MTIFKGWSSTEKIPIILSINKVKEIVGDTKRWTVCKACAGNGKKSRRLSKKVRLRFQKALEQFEKSNQEGCRPVRPKAHLYSCLDCKGTGLTQIDKTQPAYENEYPHVAIVGGGIGGVALAVACLHRNIPFTLYERDDSFDVRSQGYGLTLQQASKAIEALGIEELEGSLVSTKHIVHGVGGEVLGEWGIRKWLEKGERKTSKRTNIHVPRQSLRLALLKQLGGDQMVQWGHRFIDLKEKNDGVELKFLVKGEVKYAKADLVVGADGIRSSVRSLLFGDKIPLQYLGCLVVLGICPLAAIEVDDRTLLDSATVFQTVNGKERLYMMPYSLDAVMWQFSVPMPELEAKQLSLKGAKSLKEEVCRRADWHDPIPQILSATDVSMISGYPVYDRELLTPQSFENSGEITLLGDAAHPMSPFKGQGANQALLDALSLARGISKGCGSFSDWKQEGVRKNALTAFEQEMLERSATKVKDSAKAARLLHSEQVLQERDEPRGRDLK